MNTTRTSRWASFGIFAWISLLFMACGGPLSEEAAGGLQFLAPQPQEGAVLGRFPASLRGMYRSEGDTSHPGPLVIGERVIYYDTQAFYKAMADSIRSLPDTAELKLRFDFSDTASAGLDTVFSLERGDVLKKLGKIWVLNRPKGTRWLVYTLAKEGKDLVIASRPEPVTWAEISPFLEGAESQEDSTGLAVGPLKGQFQKLNQSGVFNQQTRYRPVKP